MTRGHKYCSPECAKSARRDNKNKKIMNIKEHVKRVKIEETKNIVIHRQIHRDVNGTEHVVEMETYNESKNTNSLTRTKLVQMNEELMRIVDSNDNIMKLSKSCLARDTITKDNYFLSTFDSCYPTWRQWEPLQIIEKFFKELWFPMNYVSWRSLSRVQMPDDDKTMWERIILRKIISIGLHEHATGDEMLDSVVRDDLEHAKIHVVNVVTHVENFGKQRIEAKLHVVVDNEWKIDVTMYQIDALLLSMIPNNAHVTKILNIEMARLHAMDILQ